MLYVFTLVTFVLQLQDETFFKFGPSALTFKFEPIFKYFLFSINRKHLLDDIFFFLITV